MEPENPLNNPHPAGETKTHAAYPSGSWPLDTPGGRFYAEWDDEAPVTREGQLIFFFQFLQAGGRWQEFLRECPLRYTGNRASGAPNVMATAMLSILCGHWRFAHINAVRGDAVNPGLLGARTVSEDAVRLAMRRIPEAAGLEWLSNQLLASISPALFLQWILDIDTTIKPLYGRQEGAAIGYNPKKPGRPSHVYHSYFVSHLRISLGVEVRPGNEHAAAKGLPGLWRTLEKLPRHHWPEFVRGDCGYGNEAVMLEHEQRALPYLFKLRHTPKVKDLVVTMMRQGERWHDCGDGWEAMETTLRLNGWTETRRVILVRETPARAPVKHPGKPRRGKDRQSHLPHATGPGWDAQPVPWAGKIAVLVSTLDERTYPTREIPRHYRNRTEEENAFDELKNQWGWNGYNSKRLASSRLMANLVALIYNWWTLYVRFYDEEHHREAIRSRPMLMAAVGRQTQSGGQRRVKVSLVHEKSWIIANAVTQISNEIAHIVSITERWSVPQRWSLLLTRILRRYLGGKWLPDIPAEAQLLLSG